MVELVAAMRVTHCQQVALISLKLIVIEQTYDQIRFIYDHPTFILRFK